VGVVTVRLPDLVQEAAKKRAAEQGVSMNRYVLGLLSSDLGQAAAKANPKDDPILRILKEFEASRERKMSYSEAMTQFGLSYHQLYSRYKPYLLSDKRVEEEEERILERVYGPREPWRK
jgi:DNA invertase Pin-like site-specific DNA recombinase